MFITLKGSKETLTYKNPLNSWYTLALICEVHEDQSEELLQAGLICWDGRVLGKRLLYSSGCGSGTASPTVCAPARTEGKKDMYSSVA